MNKSGETKQTRTKSENSCLPSQLDSCLLLFRVYFCCLNLVLVYFCFPIWLVFTLAFGLGSYFSRKKGVIKEFKYGGFYFLALFCNLPVLGMFIGEEKLVKKNLQFFGIFDS